MAGFEFYSPTWDEFYDICFSLAKKLLKNEHKFDRIICITRGGLVAARIFSDLLKLPVSSFTIVFYTAFTRFNQPTIIEELTIGIQNKNILLVDGVCDTGKTLKKARDYLSKFNPKKIITLCPFLKPNDLIEPDYWQVETSKWIIFPYEIRETIENLKQLFQKQGFNPQQIREKLLQVGLPKNHVDFF